MVNERTDKKSAISSYKDLIVYQKSYQLCLDVYGLTNRFPPEEKYGLASQMRRSAISIPLNIAEGYRRKNIREYMQILRIAAGSCGELETQLSLSGDLSLIERKNSCKAVADAEAIGHLLNRLMSSLRKR